MAEEWGWYLRSDALMIGQHSMGGGAMKHIQHSADRTTLDSEPGGQRTACSTTDQGGDRRWQRHTLRDRHSSGWPMRSAHHQAHMAMALALSPRTVPRAGGVL